MEKRIETGWLLDFYGPLITERQREMLRLYFEEDLSLAEIARQEGVSRQAVHDAIRRGDTQLRGYEEQLGLLRRFRRLYDALRQCQCAESMQDLRDTLARLAEEEGLDGL